jgi:hypothetical protein
MTTRPPILIVGFLALACGACKGQSSILSGVPQAMSQAVTARPQPLTNLQVAEAWLQCIDCRGSFLRRLNAIPVGSRDTVVRFLASALLNGPDSGRRARLTRELGRIWHADSAYAARHGGALHTTRAAFVSRYSQGFEVMWRSRAATALGVLRGDSAVTALHRATQALAGAVAPRDSTIFHAVRRAGADTGRRILLKIP